MKSMELIVISSSQKDLIKLIRQFDEIRLNLVHCFLIIKLKQKKISFQSGFMNEEILTISCNRLSFKTKLKPHKTLTLRLLGHF
jgi:hypothetical protein